jgi:hypothetical protein
MYICRVFNYFTVNTSEVHMYIKEELCIYSVFHGKTTTMLKNATFIVLIAILHRVFCGFLSAISSGGGLDLLLKVCILLLTSVFSFLCLSTGGRGGGAPPVQYVPISLQSIGSAGQAGQDS